MANLRVIKKDVVYLINEVISDCWVYVCFNGDKNLEEVEKITADAIELGDNLFEQINHYPKCAKGGDKKEAALETKKHFRAINNKLLEGVDALFDRLSKLNK